MIKQCSTIINTDKIDNAITSAFCNIFTIIKYHSIFPFMPHISQIRIKANSTISFAENFPSFFTMP